MLILTGKSRTIEEVIQKRVVEDPAIFPVYTARIPMPSLPPFVTWLDLLLKKPTDTIPLLPVPILKLIHQLGVDHEGVVPVFRDRGSEVGTKHLGVLP